MKTNFHIKGWAPGIALKERPKVIRRWPIEGAHWIFWRIARDTRGESGRNNARAWHAFFYCSIVSTADRFEEHVGRLRCSHHWNVYCICDNVCWEILVQEGNQTLDYKQDHHKVCSNCMIYDLRILSVSLLARLRNILFIVSLCPLSYGSFSNERYIRIISRTELLFRGSFLDGLMYGGNFALQNQ